MLLPTLILLIIDLLILRNTPRKIASPKSSNLALSSKMYGVGTDPCKLRFDGKTGLAHIPWGLNLPS